MTITDITDLKALVNVAAAALLARHNVPVKHPPAWSRDGFPLPVLRQKPDVFGYVTQDYRPLAILEYVNEKLIGQETGERIAEWHAKEKQASGPGLFAAPAPAVDLFGGAPASASLFG